MTTVHAFRAGAWRPSLDAAPVPGGTGLSLSLVPEIAAAGDRRWWDGTARPGAAELAPRARLAILREALEVFARGTVTIGGLGPQSADAFRDTLWEMAGLPAAIVDRWCGLLRGTPLPGQEQPDEAVALVALPGNSFTCLEAVLEQAARSAAVWLRPSRREPLSAARLVAALLQAGWPAERLGFYPCAQAGLTGLIRLTDRQVVYGGTGLAGAVRGTAGLTVHGPGRGCALVPSGMDIASAVGWLLPLVAGDAGRLCTNVRTIVCEAGDRAEQQATALAAALAGALDRIGIDPPDRRWPVAASREPEAARHAAARIRGLMRDGDRLLTQRPLPALAGGTPYLTPWLVLLAGTADGDLHPLIGHEVPFPFTVVTCATPAAAAAIAGDSLFVRQPPGIPASQGASW